MISIQQVPYDSELKQDIMRRFEAHAEEKFGISEFGKSHAFKAEGPDGEFAGVVMFHILYGGLHIRHLIVEPFLRGQGIGKGLMEHACTYGKEHGCSFVYLETLSFQALDFYLKLGFQVDFTRKGFNHGVTFHYLSKSL